MTGSYDGSIRFDTKIDDSNLGPQLNSLGDKLRRAATTLRDVMQGPVAAVQQITAAIGKMGAALADVEGEWAGQEKAVAILNATLRSTGATSWTSSKAIQGLASELQSLSGYADDTILSMQNVLLGFKNIKGDNFKAASLEIVNMATVMGMDLTSAAQAVGKALDDPIEGINSLTRQGFRFSDSQKAVLKSLVESGDMAGAQKIILDELSTTYGGAAAAANNTAAAVSGKLNTAVSELKEEIGHFVTDGLAPMRARMTEVINGFGEWFAKLNENGNAPQILQGIALGLSSVAGGVAAFVLVSKGHTIITALAGAIKAVNLAIAGNPIGIIAAAVTMVLIPAIILLVQNWDDVVTVFGETIAQLKAWFSILGSKIAEAFVVGFNSAKIAALTLAQIIADKVLGGVEKLLDVLGKLPFVGKEFQAASAAVKGFRDGLDKSIQAAKDESEATIKAAKEKQDALEATKKKELADIKDTAAARRAAREKAAKEAKDLAGASSEGGAPAADTATADPTRGKKLSELDSEYLAKIALAKRAGESSLKIEDEWYNARLKLLEEFVTEDAKLGKSVGTALSASIAGWSTNVGQEIDDTREKVKSVQAELAKQDKPLTDRQALARSKMQQTGIPSVSATEETARVVEDSLDRESRALEELNQETDAAARVRERIVADSLVREGIAHDELNEEKERSTKEAEERRLRTVEDSLTREGEAIDRLRENYAADVEEQRKATEAKKLDGDSYAAYLAEMAQKAWETENQTIVNIGDAWKKMREDLKKDAEDWTDVMNPIVTAVEDTLAGAFETLGESIITGESDWDGWGIAALRALAGVLRALGYQLIAMAAYNAVLGVTRLLLGDVAGFAAAGASAVVALAAAAGALVGAGVLEGLAQQQTQASQAQATATTAAAAYTTELEKQDRELRQNRGLWTQSANAANAYASVLAGVKEKISAFYRSLQDIGADIAGILVDGLQEGFGRDDFLYAMQEYITKAVVQAAVFTETFTSEVASIGAAIASGIANGFSADQLTALRARLATLYDNAAAAAGVASGLITGVFSSYDVGTLNVRGDQLARIHDSEMILNPGLAEEARRSGVVIAPSETLSGIARGASAAPSQLTLTATGIIQIDGREIGRAAFRYSDAFQGAAYGG